MHLKGGLQRTELARALCVTVLVLIVYRVGLHVPLPGLDPTTVALLARESSGLERLSIFALDINPLFSILVLIQLAKVVVPGLSQSELIQQANYLALNRGVLLLALITAGVQATGLVFAYEDISRLVPAPDLVFRYAGIATLVAGFAILTWLAREITDEGLGSGLWLILTAPALAELPFTISELLSYQAAGFVSRSSVVVGATFVALAVAAVVALLSVGGRTTRFAAACLWPVVLAYAVLPWVLAGIALLTGTPVGDRGLAWLDLGHPVRMIALAALIAAFVYLYARSERLAGAAPAAVPPSIAVAVLGAVALGCEALPTYLQVPLIITGQPLLMIAIVATSLFNAWRERMRARAALPDAQPA